MAQGLISFRYLQKCPLPPRWFYLYGWNPHEIASVSQLTGKGLTLQPNFFQGRLLISARVTPLEGPEDLQPAFVGPFSLSLSLSFSGGGSWQPEGSGSCCCSSGGGGGNVSLAAALKPPQPRMKGISSRRSSGAIC